MPMRLVLVLVLLLPGLTQAQLPGLGVFGDSLSDEYLEQSYNYAKNWVEQSVLIRGVNVGPTAAAAGQPGNTWGEPRRTGYAANWARAGANSSSLLGIINTNNAQIDAQVASNQITHAVVAIGANDFAPGSAAWNGIYTGSWTPVQIQNHRNMIVNNITTIVNTLQSKGIHLVVSSVPDYGITPAVRSAYPNATQRQLVTSVINNVNQGVLQLAQTEQIVFADLFGMTEAVFGTNGSPNATMTFGGNVINLSTAGVAATNAFVADGIHPHTLLQGAIGSLFLESLQQGYQTGVLPFTEQETVEFAGLTFTGNTLPFSYSDYVQNFVAVPEPATLGLTSLVLMTGVLIYYRRRRNQLRLLNATVAPEQE